MKIWEFNTKNFKVMLLARPDYADLDLSWDETGEAGDKIATGQWTPYTMEVSVLCDGFEVASDTLGQCIYADAAEFRDHFGLAAKSRADGCNYGSYFTDMVKEAVALARKTLVELQAVKVRAAA